MAIVLVLGLALVGPFGLSSSTPSKAAGNSTITFHLFNGETTLTSKATYWVEVSGYGGTYGDTETLSVANGVISYKLSSKGKTGTITSNWFTTTVTTDVILNLEYTTLNVNLYNGATKLTDETKYWVEISGWGTAIHGDPVHLPPNTDISYKLGSKGATGTITSAWVVRAGTGGGDVDWALQYTTVLFKFESNNNTYITIISGWGSVPNNQKVHLPPGTGVSIAAVYNGYQGPWYARNFSAGDSTITWKMMPTP